MIKLSIIIPVYNTEAYLSRCLDSCLHQDLSMDQYEIIAVNDGSTDRSLEILKDYERRYTNIHVYSQENKRQGAARNYGLTKASGGYIWFVDADDWIENNCLRKLTSSLDGIIDIFIFPGFCSDNEHESVYSRFQHRLNTNIYDCYLYVAPWGYVFKRTFLLENNIVFIEKVVYEDNEFIPKAFHKAKRIKCLNEAFYHCYQNETSTTRSFSKQKCLDLLSVANQMCDYVNNHISENSWKRFFSQYIKSVIHLFLFYSIRFRRKEATSLFAQLGKNERLMEFMRPYASKGLQVKLWLIDRCPMGLYYLLCMEAFIR